MNLNECDSRMQGKFPYRIHEVDYLLGMLENGTLSRARLMVLGKYILAYANGPAYVYGNTMHYLVKDIFWKNAIIRSNWESAGCDKDTEYSEYIRDEICRVWSGFCHAVLTEVRREWSIDNNEVMNAWELPI